MLTFATLALAADATYKLRLPSQNLEAALVTFAEVTGIQLLYSARLTSGLKSAALEGDYAPDAALAKLLEGTGLTFRFTDARTVTISRITEEKTTRVLGPVRVEGADPQRPRRGEGVAQLGGIRGGQDEEARGYRPVVASVGTSAPTAIEDIPRSVSVLTQEQIEKQDINDIGEALSRLPGVTIIEADTTGTASSRVVSRGMASRLQGPTTVLVKDNKIAAIGNVSTADIPPTEVVRIEGNGRTLMPGLIDNHWHTMLVRPTPPQLLPDDVGYTNLVAAAEAEATLMRGFTTVRDLGGSSFALKRAIDEGLVIGPRIYPVAR